MLAQEISPKYFYRITPSLTSRIYLSVGHILLWRYALGIELIVVIILIVLLFGSFPIFPYSRGWGYRGSGVLGTILLIVIILWLLNYI